MADQQYSQYPAGQAGYTGDSSYSQSGYGCANTGAYTMTSKEDDAKILSLVKVKYLPFLKQLIAFLERNKKAIPDNLKTVYTLFASGSAVEILETFRAVKATVKPGGRGGGFQGNNNLGRLGGYDRGSRGGSGGGYGINELPEEPPAEQKKRVYCSYCGVKYAAIIVTSCFECGEPRFL